MNNDKNNKKEIMNIILKFNLVIGFYNLYLFSISQSIFNLVVGSMNIGVWTFFRDYYLLKINIRNSKARKD